MQRENLLTDHGVKASAVVVGRHEDVVCAVVSFPEWKFCGDEVNGGGEETAGVTQRGESIKNAEIAGDVDGDEKKICRFRVQCSYWASQ